jgi:hypothetical protein
MLMGSKNLNAIFHFVFDEAFEELQNILLSFMKFFWWEDFDEVQEPQRGFDEVCTIHSKCLLKSWY